MISVAAARTVSWKHWVGSKLAPSLGTKGCSAPMQRMGHLTRLRGTERYHDVSPCHLIAPTDLTLVPSLQGPQSISEFKYLQRPYGTPNVCRTHQEAGNAGATPCLPLHSCSLPPFSPPGCSRPFSLCWEANGWQRPLGARLCFPSQQQVVIFLPL